MKRSRIRNDGLGGRLLAWIASRPTIGYSFVLFALNAWICQVLFVTEYTRHLGSIEAAYIGLSRYVLEHPFEFGWFRQWYCGIPYHNTYPPLLHLAVAAIAGLLDISPALAHHIVTAMFYCCGPVALFLLASKLSGKCAVGLSAALLFSLFSPSIPLVSTVHDWAGSIRNPARLHSLIAFGDGPHIASLTLLPLAVLALHHAAERLRTGRVYLAAVACSSVVLTNWLGGFALALAAVSYLLARSAEQEWRRILFTATGVGVIAYCLAAPWIPPSTLGDISHNAQHVIGRYPLTIAHLGYAGACVAAALGLRAVLVRLQASAAAGFAAYFSFFTAVLVLSANWLGISLMPQPHRYLLEMELGFCLLSGFGAAKLWSKVAAKHRPPAAAVLIVLCLLQSGIYRRWARESIQPIDMNETIEYRISTWFRENMPDSRVFTVGSTQFWLNAFSDTPQIGGGFGQGIVNRTIPVVHYGIPYTKGDGERTAMWLRIYGAQAVVTSGPEGRDSYRHAWRDPSKFNGILPELWRDGDDAIYAVPQRSSSLAHVILPQHIVTIAPVNNTDIAPVLPLFEALEDPTLPVADLSWKSPSEAVISATLSSGQLLFVQISYHPGWSASNSRGNIPVRQDGLGFMVLDPGCSGPCKITLEFTGGNEMRLARAVSATVIFSGLLWAAYRSRERTAA